MDRILSIDHRICIVIYGIPYTIYDIFVYRIYYSIDKFLYSYSIIVYNAYTVFSV